MMLVCYHALAASKIGLDPQNPGACHQFPHMFPMKNAPFLAAKHRVVPQFGIARLINKHKSTK